MSVTSMHPHSLLARLIVATIIGLGLTNGTKAETAFSLSDVGDRVFIELTPDDPNKVLTWTDYGAPFDRYFGIEALSNGTRESPQKYQCTELAHRFVRQVYGIPTRIGMGLGHGKDVAAGIAGHFKGKTGSSDLIAPHKVKMSYFANGKATVPPLVGSIVSLEIGRYGHVGVVRHVQKVGDGHQVATLFAQHGGMHDTIGQEFSPGTVTFKRSPKGTWRGTWEAFNRSFAATGWITPELVE